MALTKHTDLYYNTPRSSRNRKRIDINFFGREQEIGELMALWGKRSGSLVTCRGRRRIGKSTLIEVFAHKSKARFIRIEGVRPKPGYSNRTELKTFAMELAAQTRAEDSMPASAGPK